MNSKAPKPSSNSEDLSSLFESTDPFIHRHIGPKDQDIQALLKVVGVQSMEELIGATIPAQIRTHQPLQLGRKKGESEALAELRGIASQNQAFRSFIGMGYSDCLIPSVIQRNVLENPGWYTQYTPYQAEIAQGRLEALLNFQTMVMDLTGLPIANASMLDEGTAAAEAMALSFSVKGRDPELGFFVSSQCHPQTIAVVKTRAEPLGIKIWVGELEDEIRKIDFARMPLFGMLLQYPTSGGAIHDYRDLIHRAHASGILVTLAADFLSLALLMPPGELGADIAVGNTQRFGVPLGYGGPHAAFFATKDEFKRQMPGRLVGVSQDADGKPAIRLALQTREQHIRRDKATSNICTSQVLLAIMASMYAVYHGPEGIRKIAERVHFLTRLLKRGLERLGYELSTPLFFDTLKIEVGSGRIGAVLDAAKAHRINFRRIGDDTLGVSLDEATTVQELETLLSIFATGGKRNFDFTLRDLLPLSDNGIEHSPLARKTPILQHPVFRKYHSETEMLRYIFQLQAKDLSLAQSMIPLGSCTMKLNATSEMLPVTWPELSRVHPFAPKEQLQGYQEMLRGLEGMLAEITGFAGISLQPNAGSQGEYAGLLAIRKYHEERGHSHRRVCLIPKSAHGTNPASAAMAGMKVVVVDCDQNGNVDLSDLKIKAKEHQKDLAVLMVTYPSTHGVFEEGIREICAVVHQAGGQVYMDGANMNAQIGLCRPGEFGADVCHLNLHKTFCIPHGGGGPGMGPIGVASHLVPFLPSHPVIQPGEVSYGTPSSVGPVSAAPWGSASILPISWMYIRMMGGDGLKKATEVAILSANYIAKRLSEHFPILYQGKAGFVAHECIFDLRPLKAATGVDVEDLAKRLMDYGFHAPTISFPVAGTLMVEPTESESKEELDRFCEAMIEIRKEIAEIENGKADRQNNVLKNAPHTAEQISRDAWDRPYSREKAVYPLAWVRSRKFWPAVARINNVLGDRNLICGCLPVEDYF